ncbi:MAG: CSLREA domain-containing protein, partial [Xanthomonadales bacterium]|nr:CSLREA domain-containing protein [Xanthomonadales bacterium]
MSHWFKLHTFVIVLAVFGLPASAATITVNTTQDVIDSNDGLCSLREAITAVNTGNFSGNVTGECS